MQTFLLVVVILLVTIVGGMLYFLIKSSLPKYFEAKGTNQATKEDIGEITEIVEEIKSDLLQQNELLKAQLSFNNQHRMNLKSAEREAIFDYNKNVSAWLYSIMGFSFSGYDSDNYNELKGVSEIFSTRKYGCDLAEAHVGLFMHDKEFVELKRDLHISIIEVQQCAIMAILQMKNIYRETELNADAESDLNRKHEIKMAVFGKVRSCNESFSEKRITLFNIAYKLYFKMTELIHKRLKELEGGSPHSGILRK